MKKIIILMSMVVVIIATVAFNYMSYKAEYNNLQKYNLEFEKYYQKEIYGTDLTTVINKVINNNEKNNVEKGQNKKYIDNGIDSVSIDVRITDTDKIYPMETLYNGNGGIQEFVEYYSKIKFKCTEIEYHKKTGKVKYLYFEQISQ